jgi:cell division septal protein FtsQ
VKVDGIELLTYSEVLDSLKIESSVDSSQVQLNEWAEKLESQPRVQSAQLKVEGGYLLVKIQEKPIDWVVQSGGKLYELDGSLKIVSMDDVRSKWIPILSGNFRTTENQY